MDRRAGAMGPTSISMLDRLRNGNPNSAEWRRLQDIYLPFIQKRLSRIPDIGQEADDLAQEVMIVLVRELPKFERRRDGSFRAWLRQITLNRIRAYQKNRRKRPNAGGVDQFDDMLSQLADPESDMSKDWDSQHDKHVFDKILAIVKPDFGPKTWEAFQGFGIQERPAEAVALELGISQAAVVQAKYRVLKRLRQEAGEMID